MPDYARCSDGEARGDMVMGYDLLLYVPTYCARHGVGVCRAGWQRRSGGVDATGDASVMADACSRVPGGQQVHHQIMSCMWCMYACQPSWSSVFPREADAWQTEQWVCGGQQTGCGPPLAQPFALPSKRRPSGWRCKSHGRNRSVPLWDHPPPRRR